MRPRTMILGASALCALSLASALNVTAGQPMGERIGREESRTQKIGDQTQTVARELEVDDGRQLIAPEQQVSPMPIAMNQARLEDLAVFLCSLLLALGDENAAVIIAELDSLRTHAFVATELQGKFFILDPSQKHGFQEFSGPKEEALKKYSFNGAKIKRLHQ